MTPSPPAVNGQQIAELRKQFKSAWRENQSPRLEQFLEGLPKTVQGQLFVELLTWELHWLSRQNQAPDLEDYLSRFPQYREVIQHTFRRSFAESGSTVEEPTVAIHSAQPSPVSPSASSQSPLS